MKNMIIFSSMACLLAASNVGFADQRCRSTDVNFTNHIDSLVRVYRFEYYDNEDKRWRREDVRNLDIESGDTSSPRSNETLEYVGNERITSFRAQYKRCLSELSGNCLAWSNRYWGTNANSTEINPCVRNINITVPVNCSRDDGETPACEAAN